ncbi:MAG TPA: ABC transporter ATP-binding protein [Firmicutes bacterium]|nr:ABC transporter ATP-binding protein [Bacillota bacterium]
MSVQIEKVSKVFGKTDVLRGIDLEVGDGEFLSVLGPSGCGKTTLLRIIAGFTAPTQGEVLMDGQVVTHKPARERGIGMVFQHYALFPNLTVYENVAFGLRAKRTPQAKVDERVRSLLKLVRLEGKEGAYPHQLSGGQQQRVAVARALAISPRVLLLDEPLSALDAKVRLELRYELKRIQREAGIVTIYVTHDQEEALSISDRVVVLEEGIVRQVGSPEEIYLRPRSRFVAEFVGVTNLLEVALLSGSEGTVRWRDWLLRTLPYEAGKSQGLISIRPERIQMLKSAEEPPDEVQGTLLEGTVLDRVFLGAAVRFAVRVVDQIIYVDVPNREAGQFSYGEQVSLWVERSAAQLIS